MREIPAEYGMFSDGGNRVVRESVEQFLDMMECTDTLTAKDLQDGLSYVTSRVINLPFGAEKFSEVFDTSVKEAIVAAITSIYEPKHTVVYVRRNR